MLAGKRVAPHWVRRTLICERLEDCQTECGDEKRFSCEGFNYRLDPSGRGQGECELIEVPLSRMDLYSSPHNRDSNLIPHPDYDYYERDRSSAKCRASPCIDCGLNPGYVKPTTYRPPPSNYKPSYENDRDRYRPDTTAIDKYRPQNNFYESRPESWDRYGGSNYFAAGGEQHYNRPPPHYQESRPPYGMNIDRYGTEDSGPDYHKLPHRPSSPPSPGGYIDSASFGYRPHSPPLRPESDYNRPPASRPESNYNRPPASRPESDYNRPPVLRPESDYNRPTPPRPESDYNRPQPSRPESDYNRPLPVIPISNKPVDYDRPDPPYRPSSPDLPQQSSGYGGHHHEPLPSHSSLPRPGIGYIDRDPPPPNYHHKEGYPAPTNFHQKLSGSFVPYMIGQDNTWGAYGGTYGSSSSSVAYRPQINYWGLQNEIKRKDGPHQFNYFELGAGEDNSVYNRYGGPVGRPIGGYDERPHYHEHPGAHGDAHSSSHGGSYGGSNGGMDWGQMWTRRPGVEGKSNER